MLADCCTSSALTEPQQGPRQEQKDTVWPWAAQVRIGPPRPKESKIPWLFQEQLQQWSSAMDGTGEERSETSVHSDTESPSRRSGKAEEALVCKPTLNCSQGHNQHTGTGRTAVKYKALWELASELLWECCFWNLEQAQGKSKSKLPQAPGPWLCVSLSNSEKD